MSYFKNLWLWMSGFGRFDELDFKDGWSAKSPSWWLLYLIDHGACVLLLAGPVCTVSRYAQMHRSGTVWDKLLDVLDKFDTDHGQNSGPALWGSVESEKWVRIAVPVGWTAFVVWILG